MARPRLRFFAALLSLEFAGRGAPLGVQVGVNNPRSYPHAKELNCNDRVRNLSQAGELKLKMELSPKVNIKLTSE